MRISRCLSAMSRREGESIQESPKSYTCYITYTDALPSFWQKSYTCYITYTDALPSFWQKSYTCYITYTMPIAARSSPDTLPYTSIARVSPCRCCTVPLSGNIVSVRAERKGVFAPPGIYIRRMVRFLKSLCEILFLGNECVGVHETSRNVTEIRLYAVKRHGTLSNGVRPHRPSRPPTSFSSACSWREKRRNGVRHDA
jgi:hypothetical protein